jgi:hypothetical protein
MAWRCSVISIGLLEDCPGDLNAWYRHITKGGWTLSTTDHGWVASDCVGEGLKAPWDYLLNRGLVRWCFMWIWYRVLLQMKRPLWAPRGLSLVALCALGLECWLIRALTRNALYPSPWWLGALIKSQFFTVYLIPRVLFLPIILWNSYRSTWSICYNGWEIALLDPSGSCSELFTDSINKCGSSQACLLWFGWVFFPVKVKSLDIDHNPVVRGKFPTHQNLTKNSNNQNDIGSHYN